MNIEVKTETNYRTLIRNVLMEKQKRNPQFSLRSLAKRIGIQSSFLSMVLNGKRDLSEETASILGEKLNLSETESRKLILLLRLEKSHTLVQRKQIQKDLIELDPSFQEKRDLAIDQFKMISEWYHLPLLLLLQIEDFPWKEEAAAKHLGLTHLEIKEALERLHALELIEWRPGEKPIATKDHIQVRSPFHNEALQKYHTQMLEKTIQALHEQGPDERYTGTLNLAFDEKGLKAAHQILDDARNKLTHLAEDQAKNKKIFHVNFNLFRLSQNENKKSKNQKGSLK